MTRIELPPDVVDQLRAAAREGAEPVELVSPDGVILMKAPPAAGAAVTREEVAAMLAHRDNPGPIYSHDEVMRRLRSLEVERVRSEPEREEEEAAG